MVHTLLQNDPALNEFRNHIKGQIILPSDDAYDNARRVWNALYDKYPAVIVKCIDPTDVSGAIKFAKEQDLQISVRGGGHDYAGNSVTNGGLVVDLSQMNKVEIDPNAKTARVQSGATLGDFDWNAQKHGLATPTGTVSSIGVAGLTLGGGSGYLSRKHGLTIDNLLAVEMVTADGKEVIANANENEDLFWAVRGGGGNFGVATSFTYQLHEVGPQVLSFQAFYPYSDLRKLLQFYRKFMQKAPNELQCYMFTMHTPPVAPFPEEYHGKTACALIACYAGDLDEGSQAIRPLEEFGKPFLKFSQPINYTDLQKSFDAGTPKGLRWYSKAHYLSALTDESISVIEKFTEPLPGPYTMVYFEPLGGAIKTKARNATAFPNRDATYTFHILAGWDKVESDEEIIKWAKEFHHAVSPYSTGGVYLNLLSHDEEERVKSAAYQENYSKLSEIKAKWDPENLFRINHNIKPKS